MFPFPKSYIFLALFFSFSYMLASKKCETVCSLIVKNCLGVAGNVNIEGNLTVQGANFNNLTGIANAITAVGPQGAQAINQSILGIGMAGSTGVTGFSGTATTGPSGVAQAFNIIANQGATGAVGSPAGIGATGVTGFPGRPGVPGIPGIGGALAYSYGYSTSTASIAPDGTVIFDMTQQITPAGGITGPTGGFNQFTVPAGTYFFYYYFRGTAAPNATLVFDLVQNRTAPATGTSIPGSVFASEDILGTGEQDVHGSGIANLPANTTIALRNATNATITPTLVSSSVTTQAPVTGELVLIRIA